MRLNIILISIATLCLISCKTDSNDISGSPSPMGAVGNTFSISTFSLPGVTNVSAEVTAESDGISTLTGSADLTNATLVDIIEALADIFPGAIGINGNTVSGSGQVRFTENGIAGVLPEGELILVHYDAEVGDQWSLTTGGRTITNKVTSRSTEDDYAWNGLFIKVIEIEGTGHNLPGLSKVTYYANHRFGLVCAVSHMTDNSTLSASVVSAANN